MPPGEREPSLRSSGGSRLLRSRSRSGKVRPQLGILRLQEVELLPQPLVLGAQRVHIRASCRPHVALDVLHRVGRALGLLVQTHEHCGGWQARWPESEPLLPSSAHPWSWHRSLLPSQGTCGTLPSWHRASAGARSWSTNGIECGRCPGPHSGSRARLRSCRASAPHLPGTWSPSRSPCAPRCNCAG